MALQQWVRLPTAWIQNYGLNDFRWAGAERSDNTAALMLLMVLAHHADQESGTGRLTYDRLGTATGLSRTKISRGLSALMMHSLIEREKVGRSTYHLLNYNPARDWGKLPARRLYTSNEIVAFLDFHLRRRAELDALKLYYLFATFRDRASNQTLISYDKITLYTGIERADIKRAQGLLVTHDLIQVDYYPISETRHFIKNAYRLVGLDSYRHMGTTGRGLISPGSMADDSGSFDLDM